jgi:hypothetical protein
MDVNLVLIRFTDDCKHDLVMSQKGLST